MVSGGMKEYVTDDPPYSRLFVVYNRKDPLSEAELRNDFSQYGEVQDVFIVKDKSTGESKGVAYVKYPKMSEAALAMEKLNNVPIKGHSGVYKVYIAKSRGEARGPDHADPDRYLRLFVMVPKSATEEDIKQHFTKFGDVTTVKLLRHKDTNESKGLGYVKYARVYDAAKAVESGENELGFKAVIARPKEIKLQPAESSFASSNYSSYSSSPRTTNNDLHSGGDSFQATVSAKLDKDHVFRLFDIAPGLRNIQIVSQTMFRTDIVAFYNSSLSAEYALNKLQGFEYPLGEYICVESKGVNKPATGPSPSYNNNNASPSYNNASPSYNNASASYNNTSASYNNASASYNNTPVSSSMAGKRDYRGETITEIAGKRDYRAETFTEHHRSASPVPPVPVDTTNREVNQKLSALTKALSEATSLLKTAGVSTENLGFDEVNDKWSCPHVNFPLPPPQKVLHKSAFNEITGMRLFFVGHPAAPPLDALYDVFSRFGNFAGASILQRKNYGYLYYTCSKSAQKAIDATDDKMIAGVTIKVLPAEPKGEGSKRKKIDF